MVSENTNKRINVRRTVFRIWLLNTRILYHINICTRYMCVQVPTLYYKPIIYNTGLNDQ